MSIEKFKSQFSDLLRPNYYEILIKPPSSLNAQSEILSFLCSATDFPFETIQTMEMVTHSQKRLIATGIDFDPITVTFLLDSTGKVLDFFQKWKSIIITDDFKAGYYEDYIGTIEIYMLDRQKQRIYGVELAEAYPVNRSNIALSMASTDSLSELAISFVFASSKYTMNNVLYSSVGDDWNSYTRKYKTNNFSNTINNDIGLDKINDYLGKFGSDFDTFGIGQQINKLTSPFTKQINKFQSGIDKRINDITSKITKKFGGFGSNINNIISPVKKYTSGITKTINRIFKF